MLRTLPKKGEHRRRARGEIFGWCSATPVNLPSLHHSSVTPKRLPRKGTRILQTGLDSLLRRLCFGL